MSHSETGDAAPRGYLAYLLRIWCEQGGGSARWRASLQDPHSGKMLGFADLEALFEFLIRQVDAKPDT